MCHLHSCNAAARTLWAKLKSAVLGPSAASWSEDTRPTHAALSGAQAKEGWGVTRVSATRWKGTQPHLRKQSS